MMERVAVHLHLFHPEVDEYLLDYLSRIKLGFSMYLTHTRDMDDQTMRNIDRIKGPKTFVRVENRGRDVKPFVDILPRLIEDDMEYVFKLHSKRGGTGLGDTWLKVFLRALLSIGGEQMLNVVQHMDAHPDVDLVGPANLYKDTRVFDFGNQPNVNRISEVVYGKPTPNEYGFFAGTMFTARVSMFRQFARRWFGHDDRPQFEPEPIGANGNIPHAFERFFGALPVMEGTRVGLVDERGRIGNHKAPGPTSRANINEYLALKAGYQRVDNAPQWQRVIVRGSNFEKKATLQGDHWEGLHPGQKPLFWKPEPVLWWEE